MERRASRSEAEARLADVLGLTLANESGAWIDGAGWSMFPTSPPGSRLRVVPRSAELKVGMIAVFAQRGKLVAHRLVSRGSTGWIAKGDGTPLDDPPLPEDRILGIVTGIRFAGRSWVVGADARLARVSERFGRLFNWQAAFGRGAAVLGRALYLALAVPVLLWPMVLSWQKGRR
jgi:hypothetical protein